MMQRTIQFLKNLASDEEPKLAAKLKALAKRRQRLSEQETLDRAVELAAVHRRTDLVGKIAVFARCNRMPVAHSRVINLLVATEHYNLADALLVAVEGGNGAQASGEGAAPR